MTDHPHCTVPADIQQVERSHWRFAGTCQEFVWGATQLQVVAEAAASSHLSLEPAIWSAQLAHSPHWSLQSSRVCSYFNISNSRASIVDIIQGWMWWGGCEESSVGWGRGKWTHLWPSSPSVNNILTTSPTILGWSVPFWFYWSFLTFW